MNKKESRGGARQGAGNPGTKRVEEVKANYTLCVRPSVLEPFRKKFGRKWHEEIEKLISTKMNPL